MEDLTVLRNLSRAIFGLDCSFSTRDWTFHTLIVNRVTSLRCLSPRPPNIPMYVYSKYETNMGSISLQSNRFSKVGTAGEIVRKARVQEDVMSKWKC